jgi:DNA invertase Pin-like site-specific DNA recombinase
MRIEKPQAQPAPRRGEKPSRRPSRLTARHRARLAVVYVRSSSLTRNENLLASQRALAALPRLWGWPASRIRVIDEVGRPGIGSRPGFRQLCALVRRRRVGIVLVSDLSRITRDPGELAMLRDEAARTGVILFTLAGSN